MYLENILRYFSIWSYFLCLYHGFIMNGILFILIPACLEKILFFFNFWFLIILSMFNNSESIDVGSECDSISIEVSPVFHLLSSNKYRISPILKFDLIAACSRASSHSKKGWGFA